MKENDHRYSNTSVAGLNKNEWVEPASISPLSLADYLGGVLEVEVKKSGYQTQPGFFWYSSPSTVVKEFLQKFFTNGLKNPSLLWAPGNFRFRIVDTPTAAFKTATTMLALAFELELELEPLYRKDGVKGQYQFRFIIKENLATRIYEPMRVFTRTSSDRSVNSKAKRNVKTYAEKVRATSEAVWEDFMRDGLRNLVSGGLPGLGKKR